VAQRTRAGGVASGCNLGEWMGMSPRRLSSPEETGRRRVAIEGVTPEIDCGRFAIKRTVGEAVVVEADIFADGHDAVAAVLCHRREGAAGWEEAAMEPLDNDRWRGRFTVSELGRYEYTVVAWVDRFETWRRDLVKRVGAQQEIGIDLRIGGGLVAEAAERAEGKDRERLQQIASVLADETLPESDRAVLALDAELGRLMAAYPDRTHATTYARTLPVQVDRERARFSSWYELFPRSATTDPTRHGTFAGVERLLPYVAGMGFDVLYLPPIHPIGRAYRKGKNNALVPEPGDVGSPWAIGAAEGGHDAVHPELGTLEDFRRLVRAAESHGLEIALDIAFQASPDHPWVTEHPEWFRHRPDGTIQYAENPPKKYQDIYPFDFESEAWRELWEALAGIFFFWIEQGVRIFRVDNPHTKPFAFWEWLIREVQRAYPETIFLAEAFTRPKVMNRLAKLGFTQSYTYFAWRNSKWELTEYARDLQRPGVREFFRPNFWPNTPDILTEALQVGNRATFMTRLVLAATMAASYGIYGPPFELMVREAKEVGSEEYLDSEKYQIRVWNRDDPRSLAPFIARVNRIRRENPALQWNHDLRALRLDNEALIPFLKRSPDGRNNILTVVNLDPTHTQSGWVEVPVHELGIGEHESYEVHDLLSDARYLWTGAWNYVELDPRVAPAHIFRIVRHLRTEADFEYYSA